MMDLPATWNLEEIYPSNADAIAHGRALVEQAKHFGSQAGSLLANVDSLFSALAEVDQILCGVARVTTYASLKFFSDTQDSANAALRTEADGIEAQVSELLSFVEPEILAATKERITEFLNSSEQLRERYGFFFAELERSRVHILSRKEEEILGCLSVVESIPEQIREALHDGDMVFPPLGEDAPRIHHGSIDELLQDSDQSTREVAFEKYWGTYGQYKATFNATLNAQATVSSAFARARGFTSTFAQALHEDDLPPSVFSSVLKVCRENYPLIQRYFRAKARVLGLAKLKESDIHAPLSSGSKTVSYPEGVDLVLTSVAPLGTDYVATARAGLLTDRWVDVFPREGKYSNAFSSGTLGTKPYLLLNYSPSMTEVGTLAHELGHSMHSFLTQQRQPFGYTHYAMSVAETASNLNQVLLRNHVFQSGERDATIGALEEAFFFIHRYLFMFPTLSRVEHLIHRAAARGRATSTERLEACTVAAFAAAYGDAVQFDPQYTGVKWASFCHFYSPYYLFQYAIGICAAMSIGQRIIQGDAKTRDNYLEFLSVGSSMSVRDTFKIVGIDISKPDVYRDGFRVVEGYIERLEAL